MKINESINLMNIQLSYYILLKLYYMLILVIGYDHKGNIFLLFVVVDMNRLTKQLHDFIQNTSF